MDERHTRDDGGPAFPATLPIEAPSGRKIDVPFRGMSLRDWFAGQAFLGMIASPALLEIVSAGSILDGTAFERTARQAYKLADAMLAERSKP